MEYKNFWKKSNFINVYSKMTYNEEIKDYYVSGMDQDTYIQIICC